MTYEYDELICSGLLIGNSRPSKNTRWAEAEAQEEENSRSHRQHCEKLILARLAKAGSLETES